GSSAQDAAKAINEVSDTTGIKAQARTQATLELGTIPSVDNTDPLNPVYGQYSMDLNGEAVSFTGTGDATLDRDAMVQAINAGTSDHGVSAKVENGEFIISSDTGADIEIEDFTVTNGDGTDAATTLEITAQGYDGTDSATPTTLTSDPTGSTGDSARIYGGIQLNSSTTFTAEASDVLLAQTDT
ncbi:MULTISPECIES: flagellin hook IN motif-containing protein, partial [Pseudoalteromonas]